MTVTADEDQEEPAMTTATLSRENTNGKAKATAPTLEAQPDEVLAVLPIASIDVGPNVRITIAELAELTASVREHGVLQPIKVRPAGDRYLVTWGQRRLLAAKEAGLERIPAIVAGGAERSADELSIEQLVENLHRADLNPIDRATAMRQVVDAGMSQADLARKLGLAPSTVANDLGLLAAPAKVRLLLESGQLSPAHQRAIKGLSASTQAALAVEVAKKGLSAHATEELVQHHKRSEEWRKEREAAEQKEQADRAAKLADSMARVEKRIPKDARVYIRSWYGHDQTKALRKLLVAAGYTNLQPAATDDWVGSRKDSLGCDCTAWQLEPGYGQLTIREACIKRKHAEAKNSAENRERTDLWKLQADVKAKLAEILVDQVASLGPTAARLALWELLSWSRDNWARARDEATGTKRRKRDPWASITEAPAEVVRGEVTKRLVEGLQDANDFKVDWLGLAVELGIREAPSDAAAPADGPKPKAKRLGKEIALEDAAIVADKTYSVIGIEHPAFATPETTLVWLRSDNGGRDLRLPIVSFTRDGKAGAWRSDATPGLVESVAAAAEAQPA